MNILETLRKHPNKYYETENGVLICDDCLNIMKDMSDKCVDLVLTDPPYGIKAANGFNGVGTRGFRGLKTKPIMRRTYDDSWDNERPIKDIFDNIIKISKLSIIFGGNFFADLLPVSTHWLVWDKLNTMLTFSDCELIYTTSKRKSVMKYTVEYNGLIGKEKTREHPTQKPVKLITKILQNYSKQNNVIADFYLGSGTTAVACEILGLQWIGIEISEKYCEVAKNRIANEANQCKFDFSEPVDTVRPVSEPDLFV